MSSPYTKDEVLERIGEVRQAVTEQVQSASPAAFHHAAGEQWSAAGYLKHLILSIKPAAKAIGLPPHKLQSLFGLPERPSRAYDEIAAAYDVRLAEGARAEDFDRVVPAFYRFPEGVDDERAYLVDTWNESNQRLIDAAQAWEEGELDRYQIPHPAIGMVTVREMLFFTLYHNRLHARDIEQALSQPV